MIEIIPFLQANPRASIIVVSALVTLLISIVNYFVMDKEKMRELKERQKSLNEEMKKHKDNPEKVMALQKELLSHAGESMRHSLKPMLITLIPMIFLFSFIRGIYSETSIAGSWFWYYFVSGIVSSILWRKLLKLP